MRPVGVGVSGAPTATLHSPTVSPSRTSSIRREPTCTRTTYGVCFSTSCAVRTHPIEPLGRDGRSTCVQPFSWSITGSQVSFICFGVTLANGLRPGAAYTASTRRGWTTVPSVVPVGIGVDRRAGQLGLRGGRDEVRQVDVGARRAPSGWLPHEVRAAITATTTTSSSTRAAARAGGVAGLSIGHEVPLPT